MTFSVVNRDRRYILLTSANRDRSQYPDPFQFQTFSTPFSYTRPTKITAKDFVSGTAPIAYWDMNNYFHISDLSVTDNIRWSVEMTVISETPTQFAVSVSAINPPFDPVPQTGWYEGLLVNYDNQTSFVKSFLDNGDSTYTLTLTTPITPSAFGTLFIATPFLTDYQAYCPFGVADDLVNNLNTTLYITDAFNNITAQITGYDYASGIITFNSAIPAINTRWWTITQNERQIYYTILAKNNGLKTITLQNDHIFTPDQLIGQYYYYYLVDATLPIVNGKILNAVYSGANIVLTVGETITDVQTSSFLSIAMFSGDNAFSFDYFESMRGTQSNARSETRVGKLELLTLQLPNALLATAYGGKPYDYPFLFVDIENQSTPQQSDQVIYANSPDLDNSLKKITFVVTSVPYSSYLVSDVFVQFQPNGMTMPFSIKHGDVLKLTIRAPNGEVLELASPDTSPPVAPNPRKQMAAVFAITFADKGGCHY